MPFGVHRYKPLIPGHLDAAVEDIGGQLRHLFGALAH
jgi:hypothetical protein